MDNNNEKKKSQLLNSIIIKLDSFDNGIINPNILAEEEILHLEHELNQNNDDELINTLNINSNPELVYTTLLNEIYENITGNSEIFGEKKNISSPNIIYENRKTFWLNFGINCNQINRTIQQLQKFIESEFSVETSINEKSNLIIRGKYTFNIIGTTFKKYIKNYVMCLTCKSLNTEIIRNTSNRLDYLKCINSRCNSCRVVNKIILKK